MIISHNLLAMNANRQFNIINKNKAKSTEKLSSGYRINRAADDAAGLSISEKMRRQIRGLSQGVKNTQDGVSLCQVADGALAEVSDMLHRITELSVKSANGTNTDEDRQAIQEEINQILKEIDRIGDTTEFNTKKLFDGSCSAADYIKSEPVSITKTDAWNQLINRTYGTATADIVFNGITYKKEYINSYLATQSSTAIYWDMMNNGVTYDGPNGSNTVKIINSLKKIAQNDFLMIDGLRLCRSSINEQYSVLTNFCENIITKADDIVSMSPSQAYSWLHSVTYDDSGYIAFNISSHVAWDIGYQAQEYARGNTIPQFNTIFTAYLWNMKNVWFHFPDDFSSDLPMDNSIATQDMVVSDYVKIQNLLKGLTPDGEISEEEKDKNGLWIQSGSEAGQGMFLEIDPMNTAVLGIHDLDVSTVEGANHAMESVKGALEKISANRSKIGAQQNRLEHTIANEQNVVENTTAAESQIRDTDMSKEMTAFSREMILENVGQAMLAQANQSGQGVMTLLQ